MAEIEWYNARLGMPTVSVGPSGMTFTPSARMLLGDPEFVQIGVDSGSSRILVKPSPDNSDLCLPFRSHVDANGYVRLSQRDIARFLRSRLSSLDLSRARKFSAIWNTALSCLQVDPEAKNSTPRIGRHGGGKQSQ